MKKKLKNALEKIARHYRVRRYNLFEGLKHEMQDHKLCILRYTTSVGPKLLESDVIQIFLNDGHNLVVRGIGGYDLCKKLAKRIREHINGITEPTDYSGPISYFRP